LEEYLKLDWSELSDLMRKPSGLLDAKGIVDESLFKGLTLNLWKVGKGFL